MSSFSHGLMATKDIRSLMFGISNIFLKTIFFWARFGIHELVLSWILLLFPYFSPNPCDFPAALQFCSCPFLFASCCQETKSVSKNSKSHLLLQEHLGICYYELFFFLEGIQWALKIHIMCTRKEEMASNIPRIPTRVVGRHGCGHKTVTVPGEKGSQGQAL